MNSDVFIFAVSINGTKYTVNLRASENAKLTYEELVKRLIESEAERLNNDV